MESISGREAAVFGSTGYHDGELAVQERAGVRAEAARLTGMLAPPDLDGGIGRFLRQTTFAVLTARDSAGVLWTSPLTGEPGFLTGRGDRLRVHTPPADGDPLHDLPAGQPIGMIAIDFATRRRARINGTLSSVAARGLDIDVRQAFGNCPRFIAERDRVALTRTTTHRATTPTAPQLTLIERSDTFFLGTIHPDRGADASHRGGPAGFVRVADGGLWWPDYAGNNMFASLGNLVADDRAALLFVDFHRGATLQLSGTATVEWSTPGVRDAADTGRGVRFTVHHTVSAGQ